MNTSLHAHVSTYSVDCDGPLERSYVLEMNNDERESQFGDIEFHDRVVAFTVNTYSLYMGGKLTVERNADETVTLLWSEQTDEGSRSVETIICTDPDCDTGAHSQRDHYAEAMGY